jgi:hypothetical protein
LSALKVNAQSLKEEYDRKKETKNKQEMEYRTESDAYLQKVKVFVCVNEANKRSFFAIFNNRIFSVIVDYTPELNIFKSNERPSPPEEWEYNYRRFKDSSVSYKKVGTALVWSTNNRVLSFDIDESMLYIKYVGPPTLYRNMGDIEKVECSNHR